MCASVLVWTGVFVLYVCVCVWGGSEYVGVSICVFVSLGLFSACRENVWGRKTEGRRGWRGEERVV